MTVPNVITIELVTVVEYLQNICYIAVNTTLLPAGGVCCLG
jgi:hypothetical protein